jgi:hypothetical protein
MRTNLGRIDRGLRVVIGCALIAYALRIGFPATGWNQLGWLGTIPLLTGFMGYCPVYALVEIDTCTRKNRDEGPSPKG